MQIHELTQPKKSKLNEVDWVGPDSVFGKAKSALQTKGKSLWSTDADRAATQARHQDYAAKYAGKLQKKVSQNAGTTAPLQTDATRMAQASAKFHANPAAQQWVNNAVAKWPSAAATIKAQAQPTTTNAPVASSSTAGSAPVSIGGQTLDPNNPAHAQILSQMKKQGISEAAAGADYATLFRTWANQQLRTVTLDALEQNAEVKNKLESLITQIEATQNNLPAQTKLVAEFLSTAVIANHVVQDRARQGQYSPQTRADANTESSIKLDPIQQFNLKRQARAAGITQARTTGNTDLDDFLRQNMGIRITG